MEGRYGYSAELAKLSKVRLKLPLLDSDLVWPHSQLHDGNALFTNQLRSCSGQLQQRKYQCLSSRLRCRVDNENSIAAQVLLLCRVAFSSRLCCISPGLKISSKHANNSYVQY